MARIDKLFVQMVERGASDLHLTSGEPPRARIDGSMRALSDRPLEEAVLNALLREIAPEREWGHYEQTHDADFAYALDGVGRFRANYFRDLTGIGAVFRVIPSKILTAEELGLSDAVLKLCTLSKGLVLVTGPTGSGKSTTLCAMIDWINRNRDEHIITIEDPVEFVHPNKRCLINQREIGRHTQSFATALRAALREDPDIILCGELRDLETVAAAVEMAETGHLVFGTLHTNTAASTVDRIVDQFPQAQQAQIRTMLASSLRGVISQTLLRKRGGGRIAAMEVLLVTNAVAANIREGRTHQIPMAMQTGGKLGMVELNAALLKLVREELVDAEEALRRAVDRDGLEAQLRRHNLLELPQTEEAHDELEPAPSPQGVHGAHEASNTGDSARAAAQRADSEHARRGGGDYAAQQSVLQRQMEEHRARSARAAADRAAAERAEDEAAAGPSGTPVLTARRGGPPAPSHKKNRWFQ